MFPTDTEHLEEEIDKYFPELFRESAKKQLRLLIEIAGLEGETRAYKKCNRDIREVNQEFRDDLKEKNDEITVSE
jgi:hypothetical protein